MNQAGIVVQLSALEMEEEHSVDCRCCPPPDTDWDDLALGVFE